MSDLKLTIGIVLLALGCGTGATHAQPSCFSDFNDGVLDNESWGPTGPPPFVVETNGQLVMRAQFAATMGNLINSLTAIGWDPSHPIRDAETLEYRVDLIQTSDPSVMAGFDFNATTIPGEGLYGFWKDANGLRLSKNNPGVARADFFYEAIPLKNQNVTLSMSLTGIDDSVQITCRVLDLDAGGALLFEKTVTDTPGIDPTVAAVPGLNPGSPDPGPPYGFNGSSGTLLFLAQITDGTQPEVEVIYDNFCWEYRSAAELNIEHAVRLSWLAFDTPFVVEGAPSAVGPWTPINEPVIQTNGLNWMTVPAPLSEMVKMFRLQEATP